MQEVNYSSGLDVYMGDFSGFNWKLEELYAEGIILMHQTEYTDRWRTAASSHFTINVYTQCTRYWLPM